MQVGVGLGFQVLGAFSCVALEGRLWESSALSPRLSESSVPRWKLSCAEKLAAGVGAKTV